MRFRRVPTEVEAIKWEVTNLQEVIDLAGEEHVQVLRSGLRIIGQQRKWDARPGDWVVKADNGDIYLSRHEPFEELYEPIDGEGI